MSLDSTVPVAEETHKPSLAELYLGFMRIAAFSLSLIHISQGIVR